MTYGELKKRIYTLLDMDANAESAVGSLNALVRDAIIPTVNAVAARAAVPLRAIYKKAELYFEKDDLGVSALLPTDVALVREISKGPRRYGAVSFEKAGNILYFFGAKEGFYTVGYYAFPRPLSDCLPDTAVLEMPDPVWNTIAYGVCAELCTKVYPGDMKRYMRLSTEFDRRMTEQYPSSAVQNIRDAVFSRS